MKRIFNFSIIALLAVVVLAGCSRNRDAYDNNNYERATVIDYEDGTPYSIIQYHNDGTYAIIESMDANTQLWPDVNEILEGNFVEGRQSRVYNRTFGSYANIYVIENVNTRNEAYDALYYYNDRYGYVRTMDKVAFKNRTIQKSAGNRTNIK